MTISYTIHACILPKSQFAVNNIPKNFQILKFQKLKLFKTHDFILMGFSRVSW